MKLSELELTRLSKSGIEYLIECNNKCLNNSFLSEHMRAEYIRENEELYELLALAK